MNNSIAMCSVQRVGHLDGYIQHPVQLHRLAHDGVLQRLPVQEFHGDKRLAVLLADVVDGANVRMVQGGCSLGLTFESCQRRGIKRNVFWKKLQRDKTAEAIVLRFVDHTHSPAANPFDNAVVRVSSTDKGI